VVPQLAGYSGFSGHRLVVGDVDERAEALGLRSGPVAAGFVSIATGPALGVPRLGFPRVFLGLLAHPESPRLE
jgi:hypothetical protein